MNGIQWTLFFQRKNPSLMCDALLLASPPAPVKKTKHKQPNQHNPDWKNV